MKVLNEKEQLENRMSNNIMVFVLGAIAAVFLFLVLIELFGLGVILGFTLGGFYMLFVIDRANNRDKLMKEFEKVIRKVKK